MQQCDLVLIDEAHLIPGASDTMYRRFLDTLTRINPQLKVIGFTATPYRLDSGMLHEGKGALFTDIAYEVSVRQLIDDGYLCPLVSKAAETKLDVGGVGSRGGEFIPGQLQAAVDLPEITEAAIDEVVRLGADRRSWLAFCAGVEHATHVAEAIRARGIRRATIFGDTPKLERDRIIAAFKRGEIRALASMGVLTTGFNAPGVDLIAMLRPTKSTGLYVQMAGRGTRLAPGKETAWCSTSPATSPAHGPIDAVKPKRPGSGEGEAPVKVCPDCESILATAVRVCPDCGHAFPPPEVQVERGGLDARDPDHRQAAVARASTASATAPTRSPASRPTLQVDYQCGLVRHREWVCFEHTGYARQKAVAWWRQRAPDCRSPHDRRRGARLVGQIAAPSEIAVRPQGRFTEIVSARFAPCTPASAPSAAASPAASAGSTPASRSRDPRRDRSRRRLCSRACQDICHRRRGMIDPTPNEQAAMAAGGDAGGAYLESLGKSDLATLSPAEWRQLIEIVVTGYCDTLRDLAGAGPRPARRHGRRGCRSDVRAELHGALRRRGSSPTAIRSCRSCPAPRSRAAIRSGALVGLSRLDPARRAPDHRARTRHLADLAGRRRRHRLRAGRRRSTSTSPDAELALELERLCPRRGSATRRRCGSAARRSGCWSIARPRRSRASGARRWRCSGSASSSSRTRSTRTPAGPTSGRRRASPISTSAICRRSTRRRCARSSTRRCALVPDQLKPARLAADAVRATSARRTPRPARWRRSARRWRGSRTPTSTTTAGCASASR